MLSPDLLSSFQRFCQEHERFLIIAHVRPDGDAYGSTLGLGLCLQALGKDIQMMNDDGLMSAFEFLPGSKLLTKPSAQAPEPDRAIISVDCADRKRLGAAFDAWQRSPDVNIDHHVSNSGYAKLNLIDSDLPASAEVLFDIITTLKWPMTLEIASNLYVGLMTDTGNFRYRQTTARTFEVAAQLVRAGADPTFLAENCYQKYRAERLLLIREVLNSLHFANRDRVAWVHLTPEMYARSGALPEETEGLIENLQAIGTVEVAFLLEALPGGLTRGSLRSRGKVDVNAICSKFNGGGHTLAAGLRTKLDPTLLEKELLDLIAQQLPQ